MRAAVCKTNSIHCTAAYLRLLILLLCRTIAIHLFRISVSQSVNCTIHLEIFARFQFNSRRNMIKPYKLYTTSIVFLCDSSILHRFDISIISARRLCERIQIITISISMREQNAFNYIIFYNLPISYCSDLYKL